MLTKLNIPTSHLQCIVKWRNDIVISTIKGHRKGKNKITIRKDKIIRSVKVCQLPGYEITSLTFQFNVIPRILMSLISMWGTSTSNTITNIESSAIKHERNNKYKIRTKETKLKYYDKICDSMKKTNCYLHILQKNYSSAKNAP